MDLITPGTGLNFLAIFGFFGPSYSILISLLEKPMLCSSDEKRKSAWECIEVSLKQLEMKWLTSRLKNEKLLTEANGASIILKKAQDGFQLKWLMKQKEDAYKAGAQNDCLMQKASTLKQRKKACLSRIKTQVCFRFLEITEKLLRKRIYLMIKLKKSYVDGFLNELKLINYSPCSNHRVAHRYVKVHYGAFPLKRISLRKCMLILSKLSTMVKGNRDLALHAK